MAFDRMLEISIHAPREGSDRLCLCGRSVASANFYPRSPRGERLCQSFCLFR